MYNLLLRIASAINYNHFNRIWGKKIRDSICDTCAGKNLWL